MAKSDNTSPLIITMDNLEEWLGSTGYLFPTNDLEIARFDKLYDDYAFKLSETRIDISSIMSDTYSCKSSVPQIIQIDNNAINELKMVARNGDIQVPEDIVSKMKAKHRKKDDNGKK
nr:hypothetical protein [uncultured Fluviicola sp.]